MHRFTGKIRATSLEAALVPCLQRRALKLRGSAIGQGHGAAKYWSQVLKQSHLIPDTVLSVHWSLLLLRSQTAWF
jgi:hypothetical protein